MIRKLVAPLALLSLSALGSANLLWNEGINGDLTDNRLSPNSFTLANGANTIIGTTGPGDRDYFHFSLAPGQSLTAIYLRGYVSQDDAAFLAVQEGTFITEDPEAANVANLLGWKLFGSGDLGTDILPAMGTNWGSIGFTPPLTGSNYSFWLQQTGDATAYTLEFQAQAVPEPATIAVVGGFLALAARRRRAKQS